MNHECNMSGHEVMHPHIYKQAQCSHITSMQAHVSAQCSHITSCMLHAIDILHTLTPFFSARWPDWSICFSKVAAGVAALISCALHCSLGLSLLALYWLLCVVLLMPWDFVDGARATNDESSSQTNSVHISVSRSGPWAWAILDPEDCSNDGDSSESGDWISPDVDTVIPAPYDLDVGSGTGVAAGCRGSGGQRRGRGRPPGQVGMCHWLCNRYKQEDREAMASADPKLVLAKAGLDARRKLADAQIVAKRSVDS